MTEYIKNLPNLPRLSPAQVARVLKAANMGATLVARSTGLSRMTAIGVVTGSEKRRHPTTEDVVSALAYRVLRALKHNHFPLKVRRPANLDALDDELYDVPLHATPAEDLLPKSWLDQIYTPREHHEPERVL